MIKLFVDGNKSEPCPVFEKRLKKEGKNENFNVVTKTALVMC